MLELERTFILSLLPEKLEEAATTTIIDIYYPQVDHPKIRIRRQGDKITLTKKTVDPHDTSIKTEYNTPLEIHEFEHFSTLPGYHLSKTRYHYDYQGYIYHIDIFHEQLEGLMLVDVEFPDEHSKNNFIQPAFCGKEVTYITGFAGGTLASKTFNDIEHLLS